MSTGNVKPSVDDVRQLRRIASGSRHTVMSADVDRWRALGWLPADGWALTTSGRIAAGLDRGPVDVEAIRARADAATPGPWTPEPRLSHGYEEAAVRHDGDADEGCLAKVWGGETHATTNAVFIAHARADVPALCDALEHERKVSAQLRDLARAWRGEGERHRALAADLAEGEQKQRFLGRAKQCLCCARDLLRALGIDPEAP